ncbi:MAG: ABC transporter permease [Aquificae bacterium]|nr:ABC transporter permease [Aquificota bacterium]
MHLKIAWRYLTSSRGSAFLITLAAFLAVFLSVLAILLTLGLFTGFQDELKERILSRAPHVVITLYDEPAKVEKALKSVEGVENFVSYEIYSAMVSNGRLLQGVSVKATDLSSENFRKFIKPFLVEGFPETLLIGQGLAHLMGVKVGDELTLVSPFGTRTPTGIIPRARSFFVKGIFFTGSYDKDYLTVYLDLKDARSFFREGWSTALTEVYLKDPYEAQRVKRELEKLLGKGVLVRSWIDLNRPLFNALELEKLGLFAVLLLMVLVASFNISSLLFVKAREKTRDIAVLKTLGMKSRDVLLIFLLVGLSIGLAGAVAGTLVAFVAAYFINAYKLIRVSEEVYLMSYIPVHLKLADVLLTLLGTFVLAFLASLLPALRAARERVVDVLRGG